MKLLIIACSLNPDSRSTVLASRLAQLAEGAEAAPLSSDGGAPPTQLETELFDLRHRPLPVCDGVSAYGDPNARALAEAGQQADAVLLTTPVYNYDVNAAAKNAVELAGRNWSGKPVGFACAAGGKSSYMSVMGLANSLMLDFRCHIVPRFVYATADDFGDAGTPLPALDQRLGELLSATTRLALGLRLTDQAVPSPA
ncbi:MAG: NAD(P)H-dependent oxidoreductase [Planctomycetota bacterium]